jgi:hypothetical protein
MEKFFLLSRFLELILSQKTSQTKILSFFVIFAFQIQLKGAGASMCLKLREMSCADAHMPGAGKIGDAHMPGAGKIGNIFLTSNICPIDNVFPIGNICPIGNVFLIGNI